MTKEKKFKVTLVKSKYGRKKGHLECVTGLGLKRMHQSVLVDANPCIHGMINKVSYLLKVEEEASCN